MSIKLHRSASALALVVGLLTLTGCASALSIGNPEYGCSGLPEGVSCMSARDVYGITEAPGPVRADPNSIAEDGGVSDRSAKASLLSRKAPAKDVRTNAGGGSSPLYDNARPLAASPLNNDPIPVRSKAQIMRIWMAPWEGENGDLNVSGLVFTELEGRRWNLATPADIKQPTLRSLQASIKKEDPSKEKGKKK